MPTTKSTKFQALLIQIRERKELTATGLAEQTGVSTNNVYIAERGQGGRSISAAHLRKIYHGLCKDEGEWAQVLILWAVERDGYKVSLDDVERAKTTIIKHDLDINEEFMLMIAPHLTKLTEKQRALLVRMSEGFAEDSNFQAMMETWVEGYDRLLASIPTTPEK